MPAPRYILVDEEFQNKVMVKLMELEQLINEKKLSYTSQPELMDVPAVLEYLKITRRTLYKYRKKGLPTADNKFGKLMFWKNDIDKFFGKSN
jgi:hypothetical protein